MTNAIFDNKPVFYTYDGSFDGLLSVIHTAVYSHIVPCGIAFDGDLQFELGCRYINVPTDTSKAKKVISAAYDKIGREGCRRLYYVFISSARDKDLIIYRYMMLGFKNGMITNSSLANDTVNKACTIAQNVSRETEKFRQFVRFSVMENGVQYARFIPVNNILPVLTPFFVRRLRTIPFVLHDPAHELCSVYDTKEWFITSSKGLKPPRLSASEGEINSLWSTFFNTISIKERENPRLQKQMMPSRYFADIWSIR